MRRPDQPINATQQAHDAHTDEYAHEPRRQTTGTLARGRRLRVARGRWLILRLRRLMLILRRRRRILRVLPLRNRVLWRILRRPVLWRRVGRVLRLRPRAGRRRGVGWRLHCIRWWRRLLRSLRNIGWRLCRIGCRGRRCDSLGGTVRAFGIGRGHFTPALGANPRKHLIITVPRVTLPRTVRRARSGQ
jgi:hypothetical protein